MNPEADWIFVDGRKMGVCVRCFVIVPIDETGRPFPHGRGRRLCPGSADIAERWQPAKHNPIERKDEDEK